MKSALKNQRTDKKFSLINKTWSYRGEGNANLVLSLTDDRQIIRFRKSLSNEKKEEDRIWLEVDFCKGIMQPLLGEEFVHVPTVVWLSEMEVTELNQSLQGCRPVHRHSKKLFTNYAAIYPDLCLLPVESSYRAPTFCVEVKPKQGWIPIPDRRLSKCTFCLNQYLKLKQGSVKVKSQYCPLDLFSGNQTRMKHAIKALLLTPQNNLKMFKDGKLVYDDSSVEQLESLLQDWFGSGDFDTLINNFTSLVSEVLVRECNQSGERFVLDSHYTPDGNKSDFISPRIPKALLDEAKSLLVGPTCYKDPETLPRDCILSRILQIQQLGVLGSDEVYNIYKSTCHDDFNYVYDILSSPQDIFKPINSYLLATTAKDCSILIAFQRVPPYITDYKYSVKDTNNIHYNFNIGVSDLDPKPVSCIEKHRKRDYDVVVSCIEVLRSQK